MKGVIDRIEGDRVVIELEKGRGEIFVFRNEIPRLAKEGSVLKITFKLDRISERSKRRKIKKLQDELSE